mmetsp:Transcript_2296/g.5194  ORF Transcript_2296/g.5194 Transcript_2296/m.5194 type:complete len:208 (+) Transcript_2296:265-888(+)
MPWRQTWRSAKDRMIRTYDIARHPWREPWRRDAAKRIEVVGADTRPRLWAEAWVAYAIRRRTLVVRSRRRLRHGRRARFVRIVVSRTSRVCCGRVSSLRLFWHSSVQERGRLVRRKLLESCVRRCCWHYNAPLCDDCALVRAFVDAHSPRDDRAFVLARFLRRRHAPYEYVRAFVRPLVGCLVYESELSPLERVPLSRDVLCGIVDR